MNETATQIHEYLNFKLNPNDLKIKKEKEKFYKKNKDRLVMIDYDLRCVICDATGNEGKAIPFSEKFVCKECKKKDLDGKKLKCVELRESNKLITYNIQERLSEIQNQSEILNSLINQLKENKKAIGELEKND